MKLLVAATRIGVAPATVVLEAAVPPWQDRATVDAIPISDGEGDLCEVLAFYTGATLGTIDAGESAVPTAVHGNTWIVDMSKTWGQSSRTLGIVLKKVLTHGPGTLIINLPTRVYPDLGAAMMDELGVEDVSELADALGDTSVIVTGTSEQPLLGVNGLPRWFDRHGKLPAEQAQQLEIDLGGGVPQAARRSLLGDKPDPKAPNSGLGGGVSLLLQAAGARFTWAGDLVAQHVTPRLAGVDLVVYVTGEIGLDLPRSLFTVSEAASETGLPVLVIYGEGRLLRHELARFGLSGSYSYRSEGHDLKGLRSAMGPIAQTWAR